jgi:hypothetical protein
MRPLLFQYPKEATVVAAFNTLLFNGVAPQMQVLTFNQRVFAVVLCWKEAFHWFVFERESREVDLDEFPFNFHLRNQGKWEPPTRFNLDKLHPNKWTHIRPNVFIANAWRDSPHEPTGNDVDKTSALGGFLVIDVNDSFTLNFDFRPMFKGVGLLLDFSASWMTRNFGCAVTRIRDPDPLEETLDQIVTQTHVMFIDDDKRIFRGVKVDQHIVHLLKGNSEINAPALLRVIPTSPSTGIATFFVRPHNLTFQHARGWGLSYNVNHWHLNRFLAKNPETGEFDNSQIVVTNERRLTEPYLDIGIGTDLDPYAFIQSQNFQFGVSTFSVLRGLTVLEDDRFDQSGLDSVRPAGRWFGSSSGQGFMRSSNTAVPRGVFALAPPLSTGVFANSFGGIQQRIIAVHDGFRPFNSNGGGVHVGIITDHNEFNKPTTEKIQNINGLVEQGNNHGGTDTAVNIRRTCDGAAFDSKYFVVAWTHETFRTLNVQIMRIRAPEPALRFGQRDDDILTEDGNSFTAARLRSGSVPRTKNKPGTGNPTSAQRSPRIAGEGNSYW